MSNIHIHFKTQDITLTIGNVTINLNIPLYDMNTYLAIDANGDIYTYAVKPTFNKGTYEADNTRSTNTLIATLKKEADDIIYDVIEIVNTKDNYTLKAKRIPKPKMVKRKCKSCGTVFEARDADVKRGWALYCSKSCKAIRQVHTHGAYIPQYDENYGDDDRSWDAHKDGN